MQKAFAAGQLGKELVESEEAVKVVNEIAPLQDLALSRPVRDAFPTALPPTADGGDNLLGDSDVEMLFHYAKFFDFETFLPSALMEPMTVDEAKQYFAHGPQQKIRHLIRYVYPLKSHERLGAEEMIHISWPELDADDLEDLQPETTER